MRKHYTVVEGNLPIVKCCSKCAVTQSRLAFNRSNVHKDGLFPWCLTCRKNYRQQPAYLADQAARRKQWRQTHPDRLLAENRKYIPLWRANNPTASASISRKAKEARRTRLNNVINDLTSVQWQDILQTFNHACAYCLAQDVPLEQEHMQPISRGGQHTEANVIPACVNCNRRKSSKSLLAFMAQELGAPLQAVSQAA